MTLGDDMITTAERTELKALIERYGETGEATARRADRYLANRKLGSREHGELRAQYDRACHLWVEAGEALETFIDSITEK